jgi:hypothetical protein
MADRDTTTNCPECNSEDLTAFYRVEVAYDFSHGRRGSLLTEPSDIGDELRQTNREPFMLRCDDCDHEWEPPEGEQVNITRFGEPEVTPFTKDADGEWPGDTLYLYELSDGELFEDAEGRLFNRVGHGPVQGSVEIVDDDCIHAYWDVTTRVRKHGN